MYSNNLRELNIESFGGSLASLQFIYASFNEITAIDPVFLDRAVQLDSMILYNNTCTSESFFDIIQTREEVREALRGCHESFALEPMKCTYGVTDTDEYACTLIINNPIGRDAFTTVEGNHLAGFNDDSVVTVTIMYQNTRIIPARICEQFRNVQNIIVYSSRLDIITTTSFASCRNLTFLMLHDNTIFDIPDNVFVNNPNLETLEIGSNRIQRLNPNSFAGTAVSYLDLSNNRIER